MLSGAVAIRFYSTLPPSLGAHATPRSRNTQPPAPRSSTAVHPRVSADKGRPVRRRGQRPGVTQLHAGTGAAVPPRRQPHHTGGFVAPKSFLQVPAA